MAQNAVQHQKTVASPIAKYETMAPTWIRNRAIMAGQRYMKDHDGSVSLDNLLVPFSPSMSQEQYNFFKAEAEAPGIVSTYSKMMIGGLLRKPPQLSLPDNAPAEAKDWIMNSFGEDGSTLSAFLDNVLDEELTTSRAWIHVDYPAVNTSQLSKDDVANIKPFPVVIPAESVINWTMSKNPITGERQLTRVIVRVYEEQFAENNEFHPGMTSVCYVHELDESGYYRIRKFVKPADETNVPVVSGQVHQNYASKAEPQYELEEVNENIVINGNRLEFIPLWPLNGSYEIIEPIMTPLIEKEVHLYNKMSRRNHLLYNTATYTPIISSDMLAEEFNKIVRQGLGTWIQLRQGDTATVLEVPSDALEDYDRAIASAIEEMAKLGIRMLTPEVNQSGVALDIRNAAQNAQLGTLNMKVCATMRAIITFMINWRYATDFKVSEIGLTLSTDFDSVPTGVDWLRLATEWYEAGLIPRSAWLLLLKKNEMLEVEYNDEAGTAEITEDELVITKREQQSFENTLVTGMGQ